MHSKKIIGAVAFSAITAAVLTACGGGGGSAGAGVGGNPTERYNITVTATPDTLPVNTVAWSADDLSVRNPYYSIIRMDVRAGSNPVTPENDLNCSVDDFAVGALFDPGPPEDENGSRGLYRNLHVGASAGVATLGLLAGDKAGDVRVTCTVQDPRDGQETSGSAVVHVGYSTRLPALVNWVSAIYMDNELRPVDLTRCTGMPVSRTATFQLSVFDAAHQHVPNPPAANLLVQLWPEESFSDDPNKPVLQDVRLNDHVDPDPAKNAVQISTINGIAQVSLTSGPNTGFITLLATADRSDNNVANGIQDPVQTAFGVFVEQGPDRPQCDLPTATP